MRVATVRRAVPRARWLGIWVLGLCMHATIGHAQQRVTVADLDGRVSATVRAGVAALADSAVAAGLPAAPLVDKALEGASKHASDERILAAVRAIAADLVTVRHQLGASSSEGELTAGVAALRAGASPSTLADMRRSLRGRSLTVPLSVLGTLMVQGVSSAVATTAVLTRAPFDTDAHLLASGNEAARSIASGVPPATALASWLAVSDGANLSNSPSPVSAPPRPVPPPAPRQKP